MSRRLSSIVPSGVTNDTNVSQEPAKIPGFNRPKTVDVDMRNVYDNLDYLRAQVRLIPALQLEIENLKNRIISLENTLS